MANLSSRALYALWLVAAVVAMSLLVTMGVIGAGR